MELLNKQYIGKAFEYDSFRPEYSKALIPLISSKITNNKDLIGIDVGAGTGILTRQISESIKWKTLFAVEPFQEFLTFGKKNTTCQSIKWIRARAENLPFIEEMADIITIGSAFNSFDKKQSLSEAYRVLKNNGYILLLWNPVLKADTPELHTAEQLLRSLKPDKFINIEINKQKIENEIVDNLKALQFVNIEYHEFKDSYVVPLSRLKHLWTYTDKFKHILAPHSYEKFIEFLNNHFDNQSLTKYTCATKCWLAQKQKLQIL